MNAYLAEFIGTTILLLLGNGVVANVLLERTKGHGGGWLVITTGWGLSVFVAVACVAEASGAHLNPAVTVGLAAAGEFEWSLVAGYLSAQFAGAFVGAVLVYALYRGHYAATSDANAILGTFATGPAIRSPLSNLASEAVATCVLVTAVLFAAESSLEGPGGETSKIGLGAVGAIPIGLVVFTIGLTLGGTTGYAINPARDLAPRLAHAILPIAGKRDSDWGYAWIPVVGPLAGGGLAALLYAVTRAA